MSHVYLGKLTLFWCDRCNVPVLAKKYAKCAAKLQMPGYMKKEKRKSVYVAFTAGFFCM